MRYLATPAEWDWAAEAVTRAGLCGGDSETYGHNVRESTPTHRARVHVWSLALLSPTRHPRGHRVAVGVVLPVAALTHPPLVRVLEDPGIVKVFHNAAHDLHSIANHGVRVAGWRCSLARARVMFPAERSWGLKELARTWLGREMATFESVLQVPRLVPVVVRRRLCVCGADDGVSWDPGILRMGSRCNKRSRAHVKTEETRDALVERGTTLLPLEEVVPGHDRWGRLVPYAGEDAVAALELWDLMDWMETHRARYVPPVPWGPTWHKELT